MKMHSSRGSTYLENELAVVRIQKGELASQREEIPAEIGGVGDAGDGQQARAHGS